MDNKEVVLLTLLDLSAAFDTVDHTILLDRLHNCFGIDDKAFNWIKSYLTGRKQKVIVGDHSSRSIPLDCCVPQGSLLGPLFYFDYTKPLGDLLKFLVFLLTLNC